MHNVCAVTIQYEGEFNGGRELAACGFSMPAFAEKPPLASEALQGSWASANARCYTLDSGHAFVETSCNTAGRSVLQTTWLLHLAKVAVTEALITLRSLPCC